MGSGNGHPAVTTPVPREVWESLYRSDENAVVSQSPAWRDAVFASGRYQDVSLLYEFPSGRQVLMPMARRRRQPSQAAAVASWPQVWGVGGPITPGGKVSPAEAAAVLGDVARRGTLAAAITLRHDAGEAWLSQARQFRVEERGGYVVDLAGGFGQVWQNRFRGSARRAVRKAERSGLEVEVDRSGRLLDVFYELYQKSLVRWAAAQHEPLWFTRLRMNRVCYTTPGHLALVARHFGADCATWVAWHHGQPAAANIILQSGAHAKYWRGAMDKEIAAPARANDLLHRLAIEEACREGYRFYDMGGAEPGSSLARFKVNLGAALLPTHELRAERLPVYRARRLSADVVSTLMSRAPRPLRTELPGAPAERQRTRTR
ncbi:MAG: GNAT family N-acetyltransferase [Streptosporangiaceae bacterium]|nr:GNAT family N-acetyltransferase [Streptosporangiaceae bacterium]